jgi:hypothetical protein
MALDVQSTRRGREQDHRELGTKISGRRITRHLQYQNRHRSL